MPYSKKRKQAFLIELPPEAAQTLQEASAFSGTVRIGRRKFDAVSIFHEPSEGLLSGGTSWLELIPKSDFEGRNPWDWAHDLCTGYQKAMALLDPVYVEPDIEQSWPYLNRPPMDDAAGDVGDEEFAGRPTGKSVSRFAAEACVENGPDKAWPYGGSFAWHLGDKYSQLKAARDAVIASGNGKRVRITILDTGYDKRHRTKPENINNDLEYSIVEGVPDASDPGKRGVLYNPGHGTGTIGILAGATIQVVDGEGKVVFDDYLGAAPESEIIPVRVANSVVHLWTSSLAKGIDYAISFAGKDDRASDVVSISMGGLPSRLWAEAVNRAYANGVTIVAAAGNNFGGLPMRHLVWPARFSRVIAAAGITADFSPYVKSGFSFKMQGNYGPDSAMRTALAAFTPNIPWAELGCAETIDLDGAGTSSATPQIAGASGLWLAENLDEAGVGWQKVEAVRKALFSSADKTGAESSKYFGQGVLKAADALALADSDLTNVEHADDAPVSELPPDDITFPLLHQMPGFYDLHPVTCKMYEVEAAQLYAKEQKLQEMYPGLFEEAPGDDDKCREAAQTFCDLPTISHKLRQFLISALAA